MTKALRFQLYQPTAHFRDYRFSQDNYLGTLPLPSPTTVIGMLAYLCDERFEEELQVAISGVSAAKETHFLRGEIGTFWKEYQTFLKQKKLKDWTDSKNYRHFKDNIVKNRIMNVEVLRELELTIFVTGSEATLQRIHQHLLHPQRYLSLGRKEDFALLGKIDRSTDTNKFVPVKPVLLDVEINQGMPLIELLQQKIKLDKCYLPVSENTSDKILDAGPIFRLPHTYRDIKAEKVDREYQVKTYVYLDEGLYPENQALAYCNYQEQKEYFVWM
ncbi:CRISPR-associated protein Cas5 [Enterococcus sp. 669A]|uniref:CRISPR-associated protein Cas5 n=1 Tax=Candidatus Enterococcus moelleringii TaxID=2815325 RepID=A0ABS3L575_9ENTE|nr:CRISPR-associated protein Cas5 [Enterococcus sp. 669A]MBO1304769.1 CRISPR-associated protein Cas5 [Enterococcus sp. 669A]